jgi:hypothetical protein
MLRAKGGRKLPMDSLWITVAWMTALPLGFVLVPMVWELIRLR